MLGEAQKAFLERAEARFKQSEESAGQNLKALLSPVHERLEKYEQAVAKVEAERRDAFGMLHGPIAAMREGTERVSSEAAKLVNALRNARSEEHTSELQTIMRISYAVLCLKKKKQHIDYLYH